MSDILTGLIGDAVKGLGLAIEVRDDIVPDVQRILEVAQHIKQTRDVDVEHLLTQDPVYNRSTIAGAALEAEMFAEIDWAAVADEAFVVAWKVLQVTAKVGALFGAL